MATVDAKGIGDSSDNVKVGDVVQIKDGGIDVTNGQKAIAGRLYGEGGPCWATVVAITENWNTGARWGLPKYVTKVRCAKDNVVVWQVQPQDIAGQKISDPEPAEPAPQPKPAPQPTPAIVTETKDTNMLQNFELGTSNEPFAPQKESTKWYSGVKSKNINPSVAARLSSTNMEEPDTASISDSMFSDGADKQTPNYKTITGGNGTQLWNSPRIMSHMISMGYDQAEILTILKNAKKIGQSSATIFGGALRRAEYNTSWQNNGRRKEMLNGDASIVQNSYNFPFQTKKEDLSKGTKAEYDFQFIPNDSRLPANSPIKNLEDRLMEARAALGITVHGDNDIARSMKMYMYNRFKVPDTNLAHNKSVTYVFFTRPDLNILESKDKAARQVANHTDTALLWRTHPELFKLLSSARSGDSNNFNLLLSNQVSSFSLDDEKLATIKSGKSWAEHEMVYGEQYTGRTSGQFSCAFTETSDYDIINMMKLWMTYIDNVSRGAWLPWYPRDNNFKVKNGIPIHEDCHVYERALDYAASVYVFKCGPDGEDILYWTKYYGVFPISTGAGALSWDMSTPIGDAPKLNIEFAYSFKKDLSPISLLEFNNIAKVDSAMGWEPSFDTNYGHSARPFVGVPYIEIDLGAPEMDINDTNRSTKKTKLRLKFTKDKTTSRSDAVLFKANYKSN